MAYLGSLPGLLFSFLGGNQVQRRSHQNCAPHTPSYREGVWFGLATPSSWRGESCKLLLQFWILAPYLWSPSTFVAPLPLILWFGICFNCRLFENRWVGGIDPSAGIFSDKGRIMLVPWLLFGVGGNERDLIHLCYFCLWNPPDLSSPFLYPEFFSSLQSCLIIFHSVLPKTHQQIFMGHHPHSRSQWALSPSLSNLPLSRGGAAFPSSSRLPFNPDIQPSLRLSSTWALTSSNTIYGPSTFI